MVKSEGGADAGPGGAPGAAGPPSQNALLRWAEEPDVSGLIPEFMKKGRPEAP